MNQPGAGIRPKSSQTKQCSTHKKPDHKNNRSLGQAFEEVALQFLLKKGLELIDRNFHTRFAEIDLIMKDGRHLVFIEVKYRKSISFGHPAESVTPRKISRIRKAASLYLQQQCHRYHQPRFDVIAIVKSTGLFHNRSFSNRLPPDRLPPNPLPPNQLHPNQYRSGDDQSGKNLADSLYDIDWIKDAF